MLRQRIKKIYYYRDTLWDISVRQFKLGFAGLKFGLWWAFITPALLALSINFVFTQVLKMNMPNYTLFVISGIMPWFFLINSLQEASVCFSANLPILKQSVFPREFIPISVVIANLANFLLGFILFVPFFLMVKPAVLKVLIFIPLVVLSQGLFVLGMGLFLSSLNIFFRDLSRVLSIGFMVWFWVTPVFYSLDMLDTHYRWLCIINPATHYIIVYQNILFNGKLPPLAFLFSAPILSVISLTGGLYFFIKKEPSMLKKI